MRRTLLITLALIGCNSPPVGGKTGLIPPGTPSRGFDADGDGTNDGMQYDLDGDGTFDAVDVDGDGVLDGGDFDGDGVVTVFDKLATGAPIPTQEMLDSYPEDVDPDFDEMLGGTKADSMGQVMTRPSVDLSSFLPRPANQGQLSSCAAFAVAAVSTGVRANRAGVDPNSVWASTQFLYARALQSGNFMCNNGTYINDGLGILVVEGSTAWSVLPYSDKMCTTDPQAVDTNPYRIGGFEALKPFNRAKVKEVLSKGQPIVFGVTLPPNFGSLGGAQAKQVFKSDNGQLNNKHGGGHAMVLVGYDDARGAYRIMNSWGTDWGDGGYMWWDYDDFDGREGLHGFAVSSFKDAPPPLASITEPMLKVDVAAAVAVRTQSGDRLVARLNANGPIFITSVALDDQPAEQRAQFLTTANVSVHAKQMLAPGMHKLTISGGIASGLTYFEAKKNAAEFTRTLMFDVPAAVTDPDGLL